MMKRFLSILLALSMLCVFIPITASAYDGAKYGDYLYYEINSNNTAVTITDCDTSATEIVIPSEINGLPVTSIGYSAFYDCSSLTSITIPDSVTSIGSYAFSHCSSLTSITIPDSVTSIGGSAFSGCSSLTSITIPDSVTSIGDYAFDGCSSLTSITVDENNTEYSSYDGVLYNKDKTELIRYPIGNAKTEFAILDSVTSIGDDAFYCCENLTSITIPDSVTTIGRFAFGWCSSLTGITIPDSITRIGDCAFYGCSSLTDITVDENNADYSSYDGVLYNKDKTKLIQYPVGNARTEFTIPDTVTSIGEFTFYNCSSLTSITIPDSVKRICNFAFSSCSGLTSITIPDSVTYIGNEAFSGCSSLTSITIPDSVTSIGDSAFYGCSSLTSITIPDSVTEIGWYAFYNCGSLTSITIPNGVTSIGGGAFSGCSSLTSITIPDSVTGIGEYAFYNCSSLTDVYFTGTENEWHSIYINDNNDALTNATIHYNAIAPVSVTTAEITKSETETEYTFEVDAEEKYEDCYVYVAVYDENGALIEINCVPMDTTENTNISVNKNDSGKTIKVFLWTDTLQSIIENAKVFEI